MKKYILVIMVLLNITIFSQDSIIVLDGRTYIYEDDQWFVVGSNNGRSKLAPQSFTVKIKENIPMTALENYCNARGIEIVRENELGYIDLKLPSNSHFQTAFNNLENLGIFEHILINWYFKINLEPNDYGIPEQYHLYDWLGYNWPHINARDAWDTETGATNPVIVAVIDLGVDFDNQDLIYNELGFDYVDGGLPDPLDVDHHGTSMAGIIAAKTNNTLAVAGISGGWGNENPGAVIMAVRVGTGEPFGFLSDVVDDAIIFAANNGAKVINMSFGYEAPDPPLSAAISAAINYAYGRGSFLIAASGNETAKLYFPANHDLVLAVSGIRKDWTYYSTNWPGIDVTAPAQDIWSLLNNQPGGSNANYGLIGSGTSASSAIASGVAALLFSQNPNLAPMDIKNVINSSAVYEPLMENNPLKFGNGLLKADRALRCLLIANGIIPDWPTNLTVEYNPPANPVFTWRTVYPTIESSVITHYNIYRSKAPARYKFHKIAEVQHNDGIRYHTWIENSSLSGGNYFYRVTTVCNQGKESITSNEVSITLGYEQKIAANTSIEGFDYNLEQNYPNPFNQSTTINYSLKEDGLVKLTVFNLLGEEVAVLVNENKNAENYEVTFDASSLTSGIYFYKIQSGSYTNTLKMILVK